VKELLETAGQQPDNALFLSIINLGEVYYIVGRAKGLEEAEETVAEIGRLPLTVAPVDDQQVMAAAKLKAQFVISYADAFALATAVQLKAPLVTGDPELTALADLFPIEILTRHG
jgi:predicted nucleic acid-binding protein